MDNHSCPVCRCKWRPRDMMGRPVSRIEELEKTVMQLAAELREVKHGKARP